MADQADRHDARAATSFAALAGVRAPVPPAELPPRRLSDLAARLEVIARRIRTLGLVRAAEDLTTVSAELRRLGDEASSS